MTPQEFEEYIKRKAEHIEQFDANAFWSLFTGSLWYSKLKSLASQDINANFLYRIIEKNCAEPVKYSEIIDDRIKKSFAYCEFTNEEISELREIFTSNCFDCLFQIPDDEWISAGYTWDIQNDRLVDPPPGKSWYFEDGKWRPPVPHPDDGNFYDWDETAYLADTSDPKTAGWVIRTI